MFKRVSFVVVGLVSFLLGCLVAGRLPYVQAQEGGKGPKWLHAFELKVRKAGEQDFTKETKKVGIEVFRDENNNNLIYVSEAGSIAVVPAK